jgi:rod shape-determining protein MreD
MLLIVIIYIAFSKGALQAEIIGFIFGITLDALSIDIFGLNTITLTTLGYSFGKLLINFDGNKIIIQLIAVLFASIVYLFIINLICMLHSYNDYTINLTYHNLISIVTTIVITPIIFKFLNKVINK